MEKQIKIGFIGFGNMARAMADGLLKGGAMAGENMYACAKNRDRLAANTKSRGMIPCEDARETALRSDMVIVAVKPYMVENVLMPIRDILKDKIVISVAAGWPFEKYEQLLLPGTHHLSTMPNTPISVCEGILICEDHHSLSENEMDIFRRIFSKTALIQIVDASQLSAAGTLAGCGPAFASMFVEALADGGVKQGLPRDVAYRLASQMIVGTGKLQLETNAHPGAMKDAVCSPGGTTIVGVAALERRGFRSAVIDAIDAIESR